MSQPTTPTSALGEGPEAVPDAALVRQAKGGNLEALDILVARHERQIYTLALRILRHEHDAEDVTQQTFLSAVEHLDGFREEATFATWLHRIATYAALKVLRKRRGLDLVSLDAALEPGENDEHVPHPEFIADWAQSPEQLASRREVRRQVEEALDQLDEKHRLVFLLRDVEGFSVRETAEALGITEVNVKVRLLRARLALREQLTRLFGDRTTAFSRGSHPQSHHPARSPGRHGLSAEP